MSTPLLNNTNRRTIPLERIEQEDRQQLQTDAKEAVAELADEAVELPASRPTAATAADARTAISYDPLTQQIMTNLHGRVPTAELEDGTLAITGTDADDQIRIDQHGDLVSAYGTSDDGEQIHLGTWDAADVERIEVEGGAGDDIIVNDGDDESATTANLDGGEGDDVIINTRDSATISGADGNNQIINSGDDVEIATGDDIESEDAVFNAGDGASIQYGNGGAHQIQSVGNDAEIGTTGEGGSVNVVGDGNFTELSGAGNSVTVQGEGNVVAGTTGGNTVQVAGDVNGIDLIGTGNTVEVNGDGNVYAGDNGAGILLDNFDELDADGDGFLLPEEIAQVPGAEGLAEASDALIFGNIDPQSNAWHGVSREDLEVVANRMYAGETLEDIADDLRQSSWLGQQLSEEGVEVNADTFAEAVNRYRLDNPRPDVDMMTLTPLLESNQLLVQGDANLVDAPGPGTWLAFEGQGNQINVGPLSGVVGFGDANEIDLAGPGSILGFEGQGNQITSGGGNAILGLGDYNAIESTGEDLVDVQGMNLIDGQMQLSPQLQALLEQYFVMMMYGQGAME